MNRPPSQHKPLARRAVARCIDELARAILYRRALSGVYKAETDHGIDFVRLSAWSLHDQMFAHAMKVFGPNEKAGLWYLIRRYEREVLQICADHSITLDHIRSIAPKLKLVRDKTHFHLDERGVLDPKEVWKAASITGRHLSDALDAGLALLRHLHRHITGEEYELPDYDGTDATRILLLADHANLFSYPSSDAATVTYVSADGLWLLTSGGERFLSFWDFPWFRDAPVRHILNVEEPTPGHYYWPDLDVDLSLAIIENASRFPLTAKAT